MPLLRNLLTLIAVAFFGCTNSGADQLCSQLTQTTPVQYVGHAFGEGTVTLHQGEGQRVEGMVVLNGERSEDPSFKLAATGSCRDGVARVRLGALHNPSSSIRILGGRLVFVYDAELLRARFGMWHAEVQEPGKSSTRKLHGYLRERESSPSAQLEL